MIGQMVIAICSFAWIWRSWTFGDPYFSFQNQILLSPHCPKMNKKSMWEVKKNSRFFIHETSNPASSLFHHLRFHLASDLSRNNKHSRNFLWRSRFYGKDCNQASNNPAQRFTVVFSARRSNAGLSRYPTMLPFINFV